MHNASSFIDGSEPVCTRWASRPISNDEELPGLFHSRLHLKSWRIRSPSSTNGASNWIARYPWYWGKWGTIILKESTFKGKTPASIAYLSFFSFVARWLEYSVASFGRPRPFTIGPTSVHMLGTYVGLPLLNSWWPQFLIDKIQKSTEWYTHILRTYMWMSNVKSSNCWILFRINAIVSHQTKPAKLPPIQTML